MVTTDIVLAALVALSLAQIGIAIKLMMIMKRIEKLEENNPSIKTQGKEQPGTEIRWG